MYVIFFVGSGSLTVTLHFNFLVATVAVTVAVPGFTPTIFPFFETFTIPVFDDFHVTLSVVPLTFNVFKAPVLIVVFDVSFGSSTLTLHFNFLLPTLAVIVAVPFFFAVTTPFFETLATDGFDDFHVTFFLVPLILSLSVEPPLTNVAFVLLIFTFDFDAA